MLVNRSFQDFRETSKDRNRAIVSGVIMFSFFKNWNYSCNIIQFSGKMPFVKQTQ